MTTTTQETTEERIAARLADLTKQRAARKDELDLPRTMTQRQVNEYVAHTASLDAHSQGIRSTLGLLAKPTARREALLPARERLRNAEAAIDKLIEDAGDWRVIPDARERDKEWGRQQGLAASKRALRAGVEFMNGSPCLPNPLRALLTDTCAHCGHSTLDWPGSIPSLDEEVAALDKTIAELRGRLDRQMQDTAALLAEPVTS